MVHIHKCAVHAWEEMGWDGGGSGSYTGSLSHPVRYRLCVSLVYVLTWGMLAQTCNTLCFHSAGEGRASSFTPHSATWHYMFLWVCVCVRWGDTHTHAYRHTYTTKFPGHFIGHTMWPRSVTLLVSEKIVLVVLVVVVGSMVVVLVYVSRVVTSYAHTQAHTYNEASLSGLRVSVCICEWRFGGGELWRNVVVSLLLLLGSFVATYAREHKRGGIYIFHVYERFFVVRSPARNALVCVANTWGAFLWLYIM